MLSESKAIATLFKNPKRKRKTFKNPKRKRKFRFALRRFSLKAKIASEFTSLVKYANVKFVNRDIGML